jgi:catechol 2,3-dioxygenase-like lactoylglutathione lyase family enzyme
MCLFRLTEKHDRSILLRRMEIDHLTVPIRDYVAGKRFYERALRPLGLAVLLDWPDRRRAYFGVAPRPSSLWLVESPAAGSLQLSLAADHPDAVDAFHDAALAAGGRTQGEPAIRPEHNRDYYAASVLDLDGNSIEAVYRGDVASSAVRRPLAA